MGAVWALDMPQLIIVALVGILGIYCWKKLRQELQGLEEKDARRKKSAVVKHRKNDSETLKKDPKTGVYRLDDE